MKKNEITDPDSWQIKNGKEGHTFTSQSKDKQLTRLATVHGRKIQTKRVLILSDYRGENPVIKKVVEVTLIGNPIKDTE